jgi:hypothetical protein
VDGGDVDAGDVDAGPADAGPVDAGPGFPWTFVDDTAADFALGVSLNVGTTTPGPPTNATLVSGELTGSHESRVFSMGGFTGRPVSVEIETEGPIWTPIPHQVVDDTEAQNYPSDGLDLTDLVMLVGFDGASMGSVAHQTIVDDDSGNGMALSFFDNAPLGNSQFEPGVVGQSLFIAREDYVIVDSASANPLFAFDDETFTFALWFKTEGCDVSEDNAVGIGGELPHIWIGASCPDGTAVFVVGDDAAGSSIGADSSLIVADGEWHHLVGVKSAAPEQILLYVDGAVVGSATQPWGTFSNFTKDIFLGNFPIGTAPLWNYESEISVDEVAIFRRALSAAEVKSLYSRAASRLLFFVKACPTVDACASADFVGPFGTTTPGFHAQEHIWPEPLGPVVLPPLTGRAFQVRFELARRDVTIAPTVRAVRLVVDAP